MSKLLSEEQMFEAFMNHVDKVYHINLRKHLASPSPEIYVEQFLKDEYKAFKAFKAAFSLLMPIIEKQDEIIKELLAVAEVHLDDTMEKIQETKQMLEKQLEEVK